jgi:hypothetical protein
VLEHHVIAGIGNELSGLPLSVGGPEGSFPTIAAATCIEKIGIRRHQPGKLGLRAVMIDAKTVLPLGAIRQAAIHTLGRKLALEKGFEVTDKGSGLALSLRFCSVLHGNKPQYLA